MENTLENKMKFFSLYMNEEDIIGGVFDDKNHLMDCKLNFVSDLSNLDKFEESFLVLKDLRNATDEDLMEIGFNLGKTEAPLHYGNIYVKRFLGEKFGNSQDNLYKISDVIFMTDYIRSLRYVLPYKEFSADKMLEYGWFRYEL